MHLYNLLTEAIQGGGQWSTIVFASFFFQLYSQAVFRLCTHIILLQNTYVCSEVIFTSEFNAAVPGVSSRREIASLHYTQHHIEEK